MRTTLTLDDDVARLLEAEAHRQRRSFKAVVNEALRRGLSPSGQPKVGTFKVKPVRGSLRRGLDPGALNRLADELDSEQAAKSLVKRR
jgi:hypothetical protein